MHRGWDREGITNNKEGSNTINFCLPATKGCHIMIVIDAAVVVVLLLKSKDNNNNGDIRQEG